MKRLMVGSLVLGIIGIILVLMGRLLYRPHPLSMWIEQPGAPWSYTDWVFSLSLCGGFTSLLAVLIGIAPSTKRATRKFALMGIILGIVGIILFYILFGTDISGIL